LKTPPLNWRDRGLRLYLAFAAALAGIAIDATASFLALRDWQSSNQWLAHTYEVREAVSSVLALSVDCASGLRDYVISGEASALARMRASEAGIAPALDRLEALVADNPSQAARVREARVRVGEMLARMHEVAEKRPNTAQPFLNGLRPVLTAMTVEESTLLEVRRAKWMAQQQRTLWISLGGSLMLFLLLGVAAAATRADLRRREQLVRDRASLYQFQERLLGIVGHDLRNPLSAVMISAQLLLKKRDELKENQQQALERIFRSAQRIDALGNLLVDFTHARLGGGVPVKRELGDAKPALERAVDELRSANPRRAINFAATTSLTTGEWDLDRLAQVASNLMTNALRYGKPDGPVTMTLRDAPYDSLEIAVHNEGEPIEAALIPHLFDPYKRGELARQNYQQGLGLGLYVVREIVQAHYGSVAVESDAEKGTTFRVRLPRAPLK
jgi:signal transduction histidine kinase